jgi:hypothetical protein
VDRDGQARVAFRVRHADLVGVKLSILLIVFSGYWQMVDTNIRGALRMFKELNSAFCDEDRNQGAVRVMIGCLAMMITDQRLPFTSKS